MLLELLADLGADGGYRHVQRVHGLDLRGLFGSMGSMLVCSHLKVIVQYDLRSSD